MSDSELQAFLDRTRPALLGVVATLRRDGAPHAVPVWFRWDGAAARIWTDERRAWVRNALRDPRIAFSVQEIEPPYAAVVMHGRAEIATGGEDTDAEIRRITRRYIDAADVERYVAGWAHLRTIVAVRPDSVSSWGRGY
jgi:PPOX class probable F420-dependent enzyme